MSPRISSTEPEHSFAISVLTTVPHLKEIVKLLRQAANDSHASFHHRKLSGLASGFEGLIPRIERIAVAIDPSCLMLGDVGGKIRP